MGVVSIIKAMTIIKVVRNVDFVRMALLSFLHPMDFDTADSGLRIAVKRPVSGFPIVTVV